MNYINIENGFPLRDRGGNGKGRLHAVIYAFPDGTIVEQSKDHGQIVQRVFRPNGELVVTYFAVTADGKIKKLDEITISQRNNKEGVPK